jgi:hypothetical protein
MSRLALNFCTKQRALQAWNPVMGSAFLLLGLISVCIAGYQYRQQMLLKSELQSKYSELQNRTQHRQVVAPVAALNMVDVEQANKAFELTRTPWGRIFASLEAARSEHPADIALLAVKVDASKQELSISGEAKNFAALSEFTSSLTANPEFQNVNLVNDKLVSGNIPVVVSFDLRFNWIKLDEPDDVMGH